MRLSPRQFPDIYAVKDDFARRLNLPRDPEIYLMSGNGALNAFAASTFGYDFVVIHSELFSNTYERNKDALAFIVGHELGHLRLGHTRLWYQLSTAYVDRVPLLGPREPGSSPATGTAHTWRRGEKRSWCCSLPGDTSTRRGRRGSWSKRSGVQGFWPVVAQLPQSHPFTVRRLKVLYAGFWEASERTRRPEAS